MKRTQQVTVTEKRGGKFYNNEIWEHREFFSMVYANIATRFNKVCWCTRIFNPLKAVRMGLMDAEFQIEARMKENKNKKKR